MPAPPPPWPQRAVLAAALAAVLVAAAVPGPLELAAVGPGPAAGAPALLTAALALPLSAVAGTRAPAIFGALMLALAAGCACRPLERRIGRSAPLLVALLVFGSAAWALVWTDGAALAPLALAVAAFALAYGGEPAGEGPAEVYQQPREGGGLARWLAVGLLLAELVPGSPLLAGLLLPAALAVPRHRRRALLPALGLGFLTGLAIEAAVHGAGALTGPLALAADTFSLDPALVGRNLLALVVGRNVGLGLGFAPLLLLLALGRGPGRPALAAVGLALPVLGALLLPFDFAAGWLDLSFLAIYGALWHLPSRPPRPWQWAAAVLLCGLATWPLWVSPGAALAGNGTGLAAAWPRRHLPYEATLRTLPQRGEADLPGQDVRARAVSGCRLGGESGRFELDGDGPAVIWLATPLGLERVGLELGPGAPSTFEVAGATGGRTVFRPDGRVGFEVLLSQPRSTQRLWFGDGALSVHLIEVRFGDSGGTGKLRFRLWARPQP